MGRTTECRVVVEPNREGALLGLGVLEDLDLFVDTDAKRLIPNPAHPEGWVHELDDAGRLLSG